MTAPGPRTDSAKAHCAWQPAAAPPRQSLFDQGLTQVLQAAVVGLEPGKPYVLALTSVSNGTGQIELLARFTPPARRSSMRWDPFVRSSIQRLRPETSVDTWP